jgi:hypothetical protein
MATPVLSSVSHSSARNATPQLLLAWILPRGDLVDSASMCSCFTNCSYFVHVTVNTSRVIESFALDFNLASTNRSTEVNVSGSSKHPADFGRVWYSLEFPSRVQEYLLPSQPLGLNVSIQYTTPGNVHSVP